MLSVTQALAMRGAAGTPLPAAYPALHDAGIDICRSQLTLIVGKPGGGKSFLALNLLARMGVPTLAFLLDTQELTAAARLGAIATGQQFSVIKDALAADSKEYDQVFREDLGHLRLCFRAEGPEAVTREVQAFEQRFGLPPDCILIDNIGNQASMLENEWAASKALTLEYDGLAKEAGAAIICTAHTKDIGSDLPAGATAVLGNILQYARLVLSVGFSSPSYSMGIAAVKNTEGPSDPRAEKPIVLHADAGRMQLTEYQMPVTRPGWGLWTPDDD